MKKNTFFEIMLFFSIILFVSGCVKVGKMKHESQRIEGGDINLAEIELDIGAGELAVSSGSDFLMEGHFSYNVRQWKPEIDYRIINKQGILTVKQRGGVRIPSGQARNRWDIQLSDKIPIELEIDFGAGEGKLDLRDIKLMALNIDMGAGDLTVNLTGKRDQNLYVDIDGGVGHASLYLPRDIGVKVKIDGGIGSVSARGFYKRKGSYTNDKYGETEISINIDIDAGIGSIDLILR
jgi:hypothetical protein